MIWIAYNQANLPVSIISCESEKQANAYWQGKGIVAFSQDSFDIEKDRENERMGYVTPILTTKVEKLGTAFDSHRPEIVKVTSNG